MNIKNIAIYTVVIIFILFILLIAYNNVAPTTVDLKFIGIKEFTVPTWAVMVASFVVGLIVAFIWSIFLSAMHGIESLSTRKRIKVKQRHSEDYQEGLRQLLLGNIKEAEALFKRILKTDRKDLKALTAMGNVKRMQCQYQEAEEYHLKALLLEENYMPALEGLYYDYRCEGKRELARKTIDRILSQGDADRLKYNKELVQIHIEECEWDKAKDVQDAVIKLSPKTDRKAEQMLSVALEYQEAVDLVGTEDEKDAEKTFKKILKKYKTFIPAYVRLSQIYSADEDYANALKVLSEGYNVAKEPVLLKMIEDLYISTNQPDDAIEFFKNLSDKMPDEVLPLFMLGKLYYRFEMIQEARSVFDKLHAQLEYSPTLEYFIAKTESREGKTKEAIKRFKNVIRKTHLLDMNYSCNACCFVYDKWIDRCPGCGSWNTMTLTAKNELNELEIKHISPPPRDF